MVTHICFAEKHRTMKPVWCNMQMYWPTKSLNENSQDVRTVVIKNKMFFSCNSCNWTWVWKCLFFFFYQCRAKFKITIILHFFLFKCILHFLIVGLHFYYADEFSINCIFSICISTLFGRQITLVILENFCQANIKGDNSPCSPGSKFAVDSIFIFSDWNIVFVPFVTW